MHLYLPIGGAGNYSEVISHSEATALPQAFYPPRGLYVF
ncbi:hypothetical protein DCCM_3334 [Desulfocucumis palustris]|uniref:Uncharacterized protein n=1 Tax=Desulfocucumis palustris TaxID=1898651 RepID=A0A2L2XDK7_9FIRM|nr:hypothetical protein DCCM_3334 [Desulfocucumis palustris]